MDASYPIKYEITTILYALKFGPDFWHSAYEKVLGDSDVDKIRHLASSYSSVPSENSKGQPLFNEKNGTNPNDIPVMIQSLTKRKITISSKNYYLALEANPSDIKIIEKNFYSDLSEKLIIGQPVLMQLYFSNPEFSHAVLVTGIQDSAGPSGAVKVRILDPMTGRASDAAVKAELVSFAGMNIIGLSFVDNDVVNQKGAIISVQL